MADKKWEHMAGARVYKVINGRVHKACGVPECPAPWTDITWGEHTGHIGRLAFMQNKNFGKRMANGRIDDRNPLCFPMTKRVTLCDAHYAELEKLRGQTAAGRAPFIPIDEDVWDAAFPRKEK